MVGYGISNVGFCVSIGHLRSLLAHLNIADDLSTEQRSKVVDVAMAERSVALVSVEVGPDGVGVPGLREVDCRWQFWSADAKKEGNDVKPSPPPEPSIVIVDDNQAKKRGTWSHPRTSHWSTIKRS